MNVNDFNWVREKEKVKKGTSGHRIVLALSIMVIANLAIIEVGNSFLLSHFIDQPETELSIMLKIQQDVAIVARNETSRRWITDVDVRMINKAMYSICVPTTKASGKRSTLPPYSYRRTTCRWNRATNAFQCASNKARRINSNLIG